MGRIRRPTRPAPTGATVQRPATSGSAIRRTSIPRGRHDVPLRRGVLLPATHARPPGGRDAARRDRPGRRRHLVDLGVMRPLRLYRFGRRERLDRASRPLLLATYHRSGARCRGVPRAVPVEQARSTTPRDGRRSAEPGLTIAAATWWALVARWRSLGLLTPNVVVVGATNHAEHLIATALERRDMNILGVFDDREERSPLAVSGVPTARHHRRDAAPSDHAVRRPHRGDDRPAAAARVRQIMDRPRCCPNSVTLLFDNPASDRRAEAVDRIANAPLTQLHPASDRPVEAFAKRIQDLVIGVPVLMAFALPMRSSRWPSASTAAAPSSSGRVGRVSTTRRSRVEVPHDASRDRRPPGGSAGDRR